MKPPENNNRPPEFDFFSRLNYDLMLTVSPRNANAFGSRQSFTSEHDKFSKRLFGKVCVNVGMQRNRITYFGRSEFGMDEKCHLHLLFSLDKCRRHTRYPIVKASLQDCLKKSLQELISFPDFLSGAFDLHCTSTGESRKDGASLVSYLCKEGYSPFRDDCDQNFVFPKFYTEEAFVDAVRNQAKSDEEPGEFSEAIVWEANIRNGNWNEIHPINAKQTRRVNAH